MQNLEILSHRHGPLRTSGFSQPDENNINSQHRGFWLVVEVVSEKV